MGGTRTHALTVNCRLLYRLSYHYTNTNVKASHTLNMLQLLNLVAVSQHPVSSTHYFVWLLPHNQSYGMVHIGWIRTIELPDFLQVLYH